MRIRLAAVLVTAASLVVVPSTASADMADCKPKLERTYSKHYRQVAHRLGTRAPGRNIRKYGVRVQWGKKHHHHITFRATCGELRKSRKQLKRLLAPPAYTTLVRTAVPPPLRPAGTSSAGHTAGPTLEAIAACESGGNPATNTGNGFYGKYQFTLSTWASVGGSGLPSNASEAEQDMRAAMLYAREGAAPWPVCGQ